MPPFICIICILCIQIGLNGIDIAETAVPIDNNHVLTSISVPTILSFPTGADPMIDTITDSPHTKEELR
jgi:hypothetical protein